MATIKNFEDLECWQMARELSKKVYELTYKERFSKDFSLVNQIRDSSSSAMDNIAEGFDRGGKKEFIQFLFISRGSVSEVISQLYRTIDQKYITDIEFNDTRTLAIETRKKITGIINYLKGTGYKGIKYI